MAADVEGVDLVHSHTWYANFGRASGPAPLRHPPCHDDPQPGAAATMESRATGRRLCPFVVLRADRYRVRRRRDRRVGEHATRRPAGLSEGRARRVHVIHNGIDPDEYRPDPRTDVLDRLGIDPTRPYIMFVGRITRQKGIVHLLDAAELARPTRPTGALRRNPRHPADRMRRCEAEWPSFRPTEAGCSGSSRCCPGLRSCSFSVTPPCSSAHRSTNPSG